MEGRIPFTAEQMQEHSERAREDVHDLLPKSVKSILGSEFCEARLLKLYNFFQLEPVVKHLAFSLLDKIFSHVLKKRA